MVWLNISTILFIRLWPRSLVLKFGLFGLFFQPEQCFYLTTIQPKQYFSASFSQNSNQLTWPISQTDDSNWKIFYIFISISHYLYIIFNINFTVWWAMCAAPVLRLDQPLESCLVAVGLSKLNRYNLTYAVFSSTNLEFGTTVARSFLFGN